MKWRKILLQKIVYSMVKMRLLKGHSRAIYIDCKWKNNIEPKILFSLNFNCNDSHFKMTDIFCRTGVM